MFFGIKLNTYYRHITDFESLNVGKTYTKKSDLNFIVDNRHSQRWAMGSAKQ